MRVINILLVEDDHLDMMDIKRNLDKMDILYKLKIARNGEEAISMLREEEDAPAFFDIALIDINMPRMNGLELLTLIRNTDKWKDLKCFIITTSEQNVDKDAAQQLGVSGYIVKPLKLTNPSSMDAFNLLIDLMNLKD